MWAVVGFLVAAAIGLALVLAASHSSPQLNKHPWIVDDTAKMHVGIMGSLAGFAFTGVVLVVTLVHDRSGAAGSSLDTVIVMFLVAYLWWVGNAFLISFMPHAGTSGDLMPRVHFSLASTIEYRTVFLSWFALLPLLEANGLGRLAVCSLLSTARIATFRVRACRNGCRWSRVSCRSGKPIFRRTIGTALALGYAALVTFAVPGARSEYPRFISRLSSSASTASASRSRRSRRSHRDMRASNAFTSKHGRRIVAADMQLTMASLAFLWLAVVGAI